MDELEYMNHCDLLWGRLMPLLTGSKVNRGGKCWGMRMKLIDTIEECIHEPYLSSEQLENLARIIELSYVIGREDLLAKKE